MTKPPPLAKLALVIALLNSVCEVILPNASYAQLAALPIASVSLVFLPSAS